MMSQVILYSGGLDSVLCAFAYPDAMLLHVDLQHEYSRKERDEMPRPREVIIDDRLSLASAMRPDRTIRNRNVFLITIASLYATDIFLQGVLGDVHTDKDEQFAHLMSVVLTHSCRDEGLTFTVHMPFARKTKTQLVAEYLAAGHDPKWLQAAVSCYDSALLNCGACRPCIRKWAALVNNNVPAEYIFHASPAASARALPRVQWAGHEAARCEIEAALNIIGA